MTKVRVLSIFFCTLLKFSVVKFLARLKLDGKVVFFLLCLMSNYVEFEEAEVAICGGVSAVI